MASKHNSTPLLCYIKLVQYFKTINEFKLELQSGNTQFGSKSATFCPLWPEIWRMTLKITRVPLLCYVELCASFRSHPWIQTGITVRKRQIRVKIFDFLSRVTMKFDGWPWKTTGHLAYATPSFGHHFIATCEFKLELFSGNGWLVFDICDFGLWPLTLIFAWTSLLSMVKTLNNLMMIRKWEHSENDVTDGRTDKQTIYRAAWLYTAYICHRWLRLDV